MRYAKKMKYWTHKMNKYFDLFSLVVTYIMRFFHLQIFIPFQNQSHDTRRECQIWQEKWFTMVKDETLEATK